MRSNDFDRNFKMRSNNFDRNFKRAQRATIGLFVMTLILTVVFFVGSIVIGIHVAGEIKDHGLKGVVEQIWEGEFK